VERPSRASSSSACARRFRRSARRWAWATG
jgi:hypothetical protein